MTALRRITTAPPNMRCGPENVFVLTAAARRLYIWWVETSQLQELSVVSRFTWLR